MSVEYRLEYEKHQSEEGDYHLQERLGPLRCSSKVAEFEIWYCRINWRWASCRYLLRFHYCRV